MRTGPPSGNSGFNPRHPFGQILRTVVIGVLDDAKGKTDRLLGLKENVIMGHLIPAGTGLKHYDLIELEEDAEEEEEFGTMEEPVEGIQQEPLSAIGKEGGEK